MAGTAGVAGTTQFTPSSFGTVVNNGQLVGVQTRSAYKPINWGGGVSAVPSASPMTIPPAIGYGYSSSASAYGPIGSTAGGNSTPSGQQRGSASGAVVGSPGLWAFGLMAAGLLWLRFIHWRK